MITNMINIHKKFFVYKLLCMTVNRRQYLIILLCGSVTSTMSIMKDVALLHSNIELVVLPLIFYVCSFKAKMGEIYVCFQ